MSRVERKRNEVYVYDANGRLIGYGGVTAATPLSNFYKSEFTFAAHNWPFAESAIMYMKAVCFGDQHCANKLLTVNSPKEAKRIGRMVKNFDERVWREFRDDKVPEILYQKFVQNDALRTWLLSTGDAELAEIAIEGRNKRVVYKDLIWGIGIGCSDAAISDPKQWHHFGHNFLGKTLMTVRNRLLKVA